MDDVVQDDPDEYGQVTGRDLRASGEDYDKSQHMQPAESIRGNTHGRIPFSATLRKTHSGNLHIDGICNQERCTGIFKFCEFHLLDAPLTASLVFRRIF